MLPMSFPGRQTLNRRVRLGISSRVPADPPAAPDDDALDPSRRQFLRRGGALTTGIAAARYVTAAPGEETATASATTASGRSALVAVRLNVNGTDYDLKLDPRVTLLDALRDRLGLTGTKKGCDRGQCGACTVLSDGRRINACLALAVAHDGERITTIEGIGSSGALHPVQAAFIEHDGFQCGYCTPGQICSAVAMLGEAASGMPSAVTDIAARGPIALTDDEIRERMSGNVCRCGAYAGIVAAIRRTAKKTA
jgi:xanthine dehydrogenase YagT iron-sulfur-binding subunit